MTSKDEQKQHLIDMMKLDEDSGIYDEPNQALIDAAERYIAGDNYNRYYDDFIKGAKWQEERMYNEEDMIAFGEFIFKHSLLTHTKGVKSLFEQFKKK